MLRALFSGVLFVLSTGLSGAAVAEVPACIARGQHLPVNNEQVLEWMHTTHNAYKDRANVDGVLVNIYPDRNGHDHISIQIGANEGETIEVVYNQEFGALPYLTIGMQIQACGDYITSFAPNGGYPASPDGALVHWVHRSNSSRHDSGFVAVDGVAYGH